MVTPKELYKTFSADFKAERKYYFAERGEGMMQAREKDSGKIFLVNNNTKEQGNFSRQTDGSLSGMRQQSR